MGCGMRNLSDPRHVGGYGGRDIACGFQGCAEGIGLDAHFLV